MKKSYYLLSAALFLTFAIAAAGCAHYRPGTGNTPEFHSIAFAPVINESYAPQAQTIVSDALFQAFARGGNVAVESNQATADVVLHVVIKDFQKMIGATKADDTGRARSLVMMLKSQVTLTEGATGKAIYTGEFTVQQEVYADSGAIRAENEAMPQLATLLADKVYRAVTSKW